VTETRGLFLFVFCLGKWWGFGGVGGCWGGFIGCLCFMGGLVGVVGLENFKLVGWLFWCFFFLWGGCMGGLGGWFLGWGIFSVCVWGGGGVGVGVVTRSFVGYTASPGSKTDTDPTRMHPPAGLERRCGGRTCRKHPGVRSRNQDWGTTPG